ncbi:hypothetical protein DTO166G4_6017 [Paecilomyces variotii]|uniref:Putative purine-cytosine permease n=1 Tax=Byssochlamys spectabilis TaxID=264951 RepID=A0A443HV40_BYSSP|nr:putative purine-cytosine permease [Paecilomyces variotii]KAJ9201298.1 hypothetical protein DTO164E3_3605 [Paecilomyces variotii]KAJ9212386.1 hypothetical protein DTO166G4_6017 [Paecilomyces variotii]KAJ9241169.1 hypothetical protein DTO166G5_1331 [Paecilomyces variotii]KAJ9270068.1 hypothetical protein DTO212C5_3807 [Paecilomyces variotii]KAJ9291130.1 hypothetical protein DTO021C3_1346 [Paecilomyces variotii]
MDPKVEKSDVPIRPATQYDSEELGSSCTIPASRWRGLFNRIEDLAGMEARGIERVPSEERHKGGVREYMQMMLLWLSANLTANNTTVGILGPLVYELGFTDAALCATFGGFLGAAGVGFTSMWGPRSGNRTLIVARYFMGYYPGKICSLLNLVIMLGYGMIDCVIGGQILSAVSNGRMTVIVGIIVVAIVTLVVAAFGMRIFQAYERYAWLPQLMVLCIMMGSAGPRFDIHTPSVGSPEAVSAHRLSFFSLCMASGIAWAPSGADYYVYYPSSTARWKTFMMTTVGLGFALFITLMLGVGLGTGVATIPSWSAAYDNTPGNLLAAAYDNLNGFGGFCSVIVALGVISNNIPGTYSASLAFQMLGRHGPKVPRFILTICCVIIYTACALGGRNYLFEVFNNFLPLMGYWIVIWITIMLEEDLIFMRGKDYDWTIWNDWRKLPLGIASGISFLVGWAGAIVGMDQVYFVGPIAKSIAGGADLGIWLGIGFTVFVYPPLRALELRVVGR